MSWKNIAIRWGTILADVFIHAQLKVKAEIVDGPDKLYKWEFYEYRRPYLYTSVGKKRWIKFNECTLTYENVLDRLNLSTKWETVIRSERLKKKLVQKKFGF